MSKEMNPSIKDMLEAFESDNDFRTLKKIYESPNEFTIMGNKRREEWHSSFLCWLLNPKQNHKLGIFPLEKFLELVESKRDNLKINKTDIVDMEFETEHKTTNNRKIDIFGKSSFLVLVIENKIKASETLKNGIMPQSDDYYMYCEEEYKDRQKCYILLKAFPNTRVANKNFISITYQELFDEVIKPAYENCKKLKIEDTKGVLGHYALDISNPFTNCILATTQKDLSCKIYKKHADIIDKIRITMREINRDTESDICKFFDQNIKYINDIILRSLGMNIIKPRTEELKKLKGAKLLKALLDYHYIIPNHTELIYKYMSATCIIKVDENRKFYTGYYMGDYDGSQDVDILQSGFERLRDAQLAVEKEVGSKNSNGGKSAYELMLLNSGNEEVEGKKIGDILKSL